MFYCAVRPRCFPVCSLLLHLPLTGITELQEPQSSHKDEEQNRLRLTDTLRGRVLTVEGVVDVQSQHFCRFDGGAVCLDDKRLAGGQGQVLVEELESVGQAQEGADRDGGHHVRDRHAEQGLGLCGAVDFCRLQHVFRHRLQSCDIDDHHIPDLLPAHQDDESPEAVFGLQQDRRAVAGQNAIEDHGPDIAQNNTADQVRHEEDRTVDIAAPDALRQGIGRRKAQDVDEHQAHDGKQRRVPEGVHKACILDGGDIVVKADPACLGDQLEFAEGKINALDKGPDEADTEGRRHRAKEEPAPAPHRVLEDAFHSFHSLFLLKNGADEKVRPMSIMLAQGFRDQPLAAAYWVAQPSMAAVTTSSQLASLWSAQYWFSAETRPARYSSTLG